VRKIKKSDATTSEIKERGNLRKLLDPRKVRHLYENLGKTDAEIAEMFKCHRTVVVKIRKQYNIHTRKSIGVIGEEMVEKELRSRGYHVINMNNKDKTYPYDLLVDDVCRVEVKSASLHKNGYFHFVLAEKPESDKIESDVRIRLKNNRTRKLYRKTCDVIVLAGIEDNGDCHFFILHPEDISDYIQTITVPLSPFSNSKYNLYRERWELFEQVLSQKSIKRADAATSDK
jgi:Holliday junction resolvase-like predicted endonuclease